MFNRTMAFRWISNQPGRLAVVVLATPNENVFFANHLSSITIFQKKAFKVLIYREYSA